MGHKPKQWYTVKQGYMRERHERVSLLEAPRPFVRARVCSLLLYQT